MTHWSLLWLICWCYYSLVVTEPDKKKWACKCHLCVNKCPNGGKAGEGVRKDKGCKGQLTSSKGPGRMGIRHHEQGTAFQVRAFSVLIHM